MLVISSEDNSQVGVADSENKLECTSEVTSSECGVLFENSTKDSAVNVESFLKSQKEDNIEECMIHDNSRSLPVLSNSGDLETEDSTVHPEQVDRSMLSENEEELVVGVFSGSSGSRHSSPLSAECIQYDEVNERKMKRKQRNKRKRRSAGLDKEGLKTEYVFYTARCIILNYLKSSGHLFRLGLNSLE
jgi:hypothetical protein